MKMHDDLLQKVSEDVQIVVPSRDAKSQWEKLPSDFVVPEEGQLIAAGVNSINFSKPPAWIVGPATYTATGAK